MGFDQHHQPVAQREIAAGKTRRVGGFHKATGGVVVVGKAGVEIHRQRALGFQLGNDAGLERFAGFAQGFIAHIDRVAGDGNIVAKFGAIGDMQIQCGQWIPSIDQRQHRLHFWGVGLHIIAVEVVALGGHAKAHFCRPALVGAVPRFEVFVAINIEHRHKQQHQLVQHTFANLALQQITQQPEAGIFAVDFTGMNAALRQHHRHALGACIFGGECATGGHRQRFHRPALRADAKVKTAHRFRERQLEGIAQGNDLVITAGLLVAAAFGHGAKIGFGGHRDGWGGKQSKGKQAAIHEGVSGGTCRW